MGAAGGRSPTAGPAEGHRVALVSRAGGEAFGSAPKQAKPGATAGPRDASRGASSPEHWPPPGTPRSPRHGLRVGNVCFPVFLSKDSHPQHHRWGTAPGAAATPCPPAAPQLRFQQAQPQPDGNLQQRLFSAAGRPRGVGKSCRAKAAAPRGAGGAPGLSHTECLRHGIDIYFFFSFFLIIKRLKQESTATNTKV